MSTKVSSHGASNSPGHNHTAAVVGEVVGSHIHPGVEAGRNSEVCKHVNIGEGDGEASNPTGSSLAGVGTAVVVELHILRGIQIQDSLTFLLADVIEKKKQRYRRCLLGVG
jgi:hypothetical protein